MSKEEVKKKKTMANACYGCKYRGEVPGSAHSRCNHPETKGAGGELGGLMSALSGGHTPPMKTGLKVKGHPRGIAGGWFGHPLNFDPTWLLECSGFKKK